MDQYANFDQLKPQLAFPVITNIQTPDSITQGLNALYKKSKNSKPQKPKQPRKDLNRIKSNATDQMAIDTRGLSREEIRISRQIFLIDTKDMPKVNKKIKKTRLGVNWHQSLGPYDDNVDVIHTIISAPTIHIDGHTNNDGRIMCSSSASGFTLENKLADYIGTIAPVNNSESS